MENTPAPAEKQMTSTDPPPAPIANGTAKPPAAPTEEKKLSGAELKKLQKAEKAAKRAQKKAEDGKSQVPPPGSSKSVKKEKQQAGAKGAPAKGSAKEAPATAAGTGKEQTSMPHRTRRPSTTAPAAKPVKAPPVKHVSLFGHLYGQPRRYGIEGATKDVHPAILALGLQMSSYEVCGSTARCVAMLLAFKSVCLPPPSSIYPRY
jgi:translation initiation factor eIF-2B subunit delta